MAQSLEVVHGLAPAAFIQAGQSAVMGRSHAVRRAMTLHSGSRHARTAHAELSRSVVSSRGRRAAPLHMSADDDELPKFGWTHGAEILNGRIAMLAFLLGCLTQAINADHPTFLEQIMAIPAFVESLPHF
ncbi:hypothetical protein FVE85_3901 [Porphyridium purpureum]|uniref:Uncharacterized protein n=1 Tax=Porphyridium purpureum TaxID=35688 RepID=A0A5J4YRK4_PORPP|nr:hypothetical protein FVE85_3901 [Porphyridium purpureum]|eukprot:POR4571..scf229_5